MVLAFLEDLVSEAIAVSGVCVPVMAAAFFVFALPFSLFSK